MQMIKWKKKQFQPRVEVWCFWPRAWSTRKMHWIAWWERIVFWLVIVRTQKFRTWNYIFIHTTYIHLTSQIHHSRVQTSWICFSTMNQKKKLWSITKYGLTSSSWSFLKKSLTLANMSWKLEMEGRIAKCTSILSLFSSTCMVKSWFRTS